MVAVLLNFSGGEQSDQRTTVWPWDCIFEVELPA